MLKLRSLVAPVFFLAAAFVMAQANPPASPAVPSPAGPKDSGHSGPLNNDAPGNARVLVPDGTSLSDAQGATGGAWFVAKVEQGKSYVLETIDPYGDLTSNCVNTSVYDSDGITTPPADAEVAHADNVAPALNVSDDGERIAIRPDIGAAFPTYRTFYFKVTQCVTSDAFQIRLRESTLYSRWTVNGYNMFTALQNTTANDVQVQLIYYSDAGGPSGFVATDGGVVVPAFGAIQVTRTANSLSPNHGALRIQWWGLGDGLVPGQVNAQIYAFNPAANNYLTFLPERINDGRTGRSW